MYIRCCQAFPDVFPKLVLEMERRDVLYRPLVQLVLCFSWKNPGSDITGTSPDITFIVPVTSGFSGHQDSDNLKFVWIPYYFAIRLQSLNFARRPMAASTAAFIFFV